MKATVYPVPEPIAESLSILNGLATLFFTLGGIFASLPIGVLISSIFVEHITEMEQRAINLVFGAGAVIAVVLFGLAITCTCKRRSTWDKVKTASQIKPPSSA
jgi:hypothetical protein